MAIADAGVEMYDIVAACEVVSHSSQLLLDPTLGESESAARTSSLVLSYMPSLKQVSLTLQDGRTSLSTLEKMTELCLDGCARIAGAMRKCLEKAMLEKLKVL